MYILWRNVFSASGNELVQTGVVVYYCEQTITIQSCYHVTRV